jgi:hypothetical protein
MVMVDILLRMEAITRDNGTSIACKVKESFIICQASWPMTVDGPKIRFTALASSIMITLGTLNQSITRIFQRQSNSGSRTKVN